MTPDWPELLSRWNWEPSIVIGVSLIVGVYLWLGNVLPWKIGKVARQSRRQVAWFVGGMVVLLFALVSPLDAWGEEYLFSAHMAQHLLLMLAVPPMLILGFPEWIVHRAAAIPVVKRVGKILNLTGDCVLSFQCNLFNLAYPRGL